MHAPTDVIAYRVDDACRVLGIGRTMLYALINEGRLLTIRIGKRTLISRASMEALISEAIRAY